jgi:hypothetical protein
MSKANAVDFQFTGVFRFQRRLFVTLEEKVGGPRAVRGLPRELPRAISAEELGTEVLAALDSFRDAGRSITAPEWESMNRELLAAFQVKSVAAFERKKREVTVRRDCKSHSIRLVGPRNEELEISVPTPQLLGLEIQRLLA